MNVAANQLYPVAHPLEDQHPFIVGCDRRAGLGQTLGNGDRSQKRLVKLLRLDLGIEIVVLLVQHKKAVIFRGVLCQFIKVTIFFGGTTKNGWKT